MNLIQEHNELKLKGSDELEKIIDRAIKKVKGHKENDLCKFLPGEGGGYMHHFTLRKMKFTEPTNLSTMLQKFIINVDHPGIISPKPRAPRGSRKKRDVVSFSRIDIERVLELARQVGDKDLLAKFSPKKSLPSLKRDLIRTIRENRVLPELWEAYVEAIYNIAQQNS